MYWFYHTLTWIHHGCTCVPHPERPSNLPPHPIPLGHPSAPAPSILYHALNLDWRFVSHMTIYMFQCHSPISSHPRPLPQSPKYCSIHLCLSCCLTSIYILFNLLSSIRTRSIWPSFVKKKKHSLSRRGFFLHLFYKDPPFTQKIISDFNTIQWHHRPKFSWRVAGNSHFASTDLNYWKDALISWIAYNHNTQVNHFFQQNITECLLHRPHNQPPTP